MMKGKMMTTTTERRVAKLTFEEGKYVARYNGRLLAKSFSKEYVVEKIRSRDCSRAMELGVYDVEEESHMTTEGVNPEILEEEDAIEFDINTRFEFLESLVKMIVQKNIPSLLITGEGGLGKTFTVKKVVSEAGLDDVANHMEEQRQELLNFEAAMEDFYRVEGVSYSALIQTALNSIVGLVLAHPHGGQKFWVRVSPVLDCGYGNAKEISEFAVCGAVEAKLGAFLCVFWLVEARPANGGHGLPQMKNPPRFLGRA
jgi:hypothetical protein